MIHETLMSKNVKIFQGPTDRPTDMTNPRSSSSDLKTAKKIEDSFDLNQISICIKIGVGPQLKSFLKNNCVGIVFG